ncbi:hypothetical protein LOTGIDRAFT_236322, partial [Lottia gigantea]
MSVEPSPHLDVAESIPSENTAEDDMLDPVPSVSSSLPPVVGIRSDHTYNSSASYEEIDLGDGWRKRLIQRFGMKTGKKYDVVIYSPEGRKFRTRQELASFCEMNDIDVDLSIFSVKPGDIPGQEDAEEDTEEQLVSEEVPGPAVVDDTSEPTVSNGGDVKSSSKEVKQKRKSVDSAKKTKTKGKESDKILPAESSSGDHTYIASGVSEDEELLPPGWKKRVVQRSGGKTIGRFDIYVYSPDGKKFRSKTEIAAFLDQNNITHITTDDFDYVKIKNKELAKYGFTNFKTSTPSEKKSAKKESVRKDKKQSEKVKVKKVSPTKKVSTPVGGSKLVIKMFSTPSPKLKNVKKNSAGGMKKTFSPFKATKKRKRSVSVEKSLDTLMFQLSLAPSEILAADVNDTIVDYLEDDDDIVHEYVDQNQSLELFDDKSTEGSGLDSSGNATATSIEDRLSDSEIYTSAISRLEKSEMNGDRGISPDSETDISM